MGLLQQDDRIRERGRYDIIYYLVSSTDSVHEFFISCFHRFAHHQHLLCFNESKRIRKVQESEQKNNQTI